MSHSQTEAELRGGVWNDGSQHPAVSFRIHRWVQRWELGWGGFLSNGQQLSDPPEEAPRWAKNPYQVGSLQVVGDCGRKDFRNELGWLTQQRCVVFKGHFMRDPNVLSYRGGGAGCGSGEGSGLGFYRKKDVLMRR